MPDAAEGVTLAGFLAARLDEDEQYAKASRPLQEAAMQMLGSDWPTGKLAGDRMLREVEAKRMILALHKADRDPRDEWYGSDVRCDECGYEGGNVNTGLRAIQR